MLTPSTLIDVKQGSPEWHEFRNGGIGGSEIAAIMGLDKYKTQLDIQRAKLGLVSNPFTGNSRTDLGLILEPHVASRYTDQTGFKVRSQPCKIHRNCNWVRSSIDRQIIGTGRDTPGILEIKTTNPWTYREAKLTGLPETWVLQLQHYLEVWDYDWGAYAVMDRESGDMMTFEVPRDKQLGVAIVMHVEVWWKRHIIDREPIEVEKPADVRLPAVGGELVHDDSAEWADAVEALTTAEEINTQAQNLHTAAKIRLIELMGGDDTVQGAGLRVYHREQAGRRSLDKKRLQSAHPDIDLDDFMKQGQPFRSMRTYIVEGGA